MTDTVTILPTDVGLDAGKVAVATITFTVGGLPNGRYLVTPRNFYPDQWVVLHDNPDIGWPLDNDVAPDVRQRYAHLRGSYENGASISDVVVLPSHPREALDGVPYVVYDAADMVKIKVARNVLGNAWIDGDNRTLGYDLPVVGLWVTAGDTEVEADLNLAQRRLAEATQRAERAERTLATAQMSLATAQSNLQAERAKHVAVRRALIDEAVERSWCEELNDFLDSVGYEKWEVTYEVEISFTCEITRSGCESEEDAIREAAYEEMTSGYSSDLDYTVTRLSDNR